MIFLANKTVFQAKKRFLTIYFFIILKKQSRTHVQIEQNIVTLQYLQHLPFLCQEKKTLECPPLKLIGKYSTVVTLFYQFKITYSLL